jgi:spermidine synthase
MKTLLFSILAFSNAFAVERYEETLYPEWGQSFTLSKELYREKTAHQDLVIFENDRFGRVLALDGSIQTTEADEAIYHEMLAHVPILTHGSAESVLVIGGGDGGTIREVLKHPTVKRVVLVEIDDSVIALSKKYLPKLSSGAFEDSRLHVVIENAANYVKESQESFDVILCDSSDPIGPGQVLFTSEFYGDCKALLNTNGIFVNQNGAPFLQKEELLLTYHNRKPHFKHVDYYVAAIPSYVGGFMALGWASDKKYRVSEKLLEARLRHLKTPLFYYTPAIHKAAFALPNYMLNMLKEEKKSSGIKEILHTS